MMLYVSSPSALHAIIAAVSSDWNGFMSRAPDLHPDLLAILFFSLIILCIIKPFRSKGFCRIKKLPALDQPIRLGPKKLTFWKKRFKDSKIDAQILTDYKLVDKYKPQLLRKIYLVFVFFTTGP